MMNFFAPEDGMEGFPETSVRNYHSFLRNIPEERRSQIMIYNFMWPSYFLPLRYKYSP